MWTAGRTAKKVFKQPGAFALAVIKQFRANQGVLLAGAVAYYTLLSLVPLLILILMALSHIVPEDRLDPKWISRVCSPGAISCLSRGSSDFPRSKTSRRRLFVRHHAFL